MSRQDWINIWLLLKDIAGREKDTMVCVVVEAISKSVGALIQILGMGWIVNEMYAGSGYGDLVSGIVMLLGGSALCTMIAARAGEYLDQKQAYTRELDAQVLNRKSLHMDYEYLEDTHVQDLRSRAFAKSFYGIRGWYMVLIRGIAEKAIAVISTVSVLLPRLVKAAETGSAEDFLTSALVLFLVILVLNWTAFKMKLRYAGILNTGYNAVDNLFTRKRYYMDLLAGMESQKDLRIYDQRAAVNREMEKLCEELQRSERIRGRHCIRRNRVTVINTALTGILIYWFVCRSAYAGVIPVGDVIVFSAAVVNVCTAISNLATSVGNLKSVAFYAQDYLEFMNLEKRKYPGTIPVEKRRDNRFHVAFENVSFRYPGTDVDVIRNLTLSFEIGEKMAIVGRNGSGKSTFIKLLCRLYDVTEGCIKVNGIDIRKYDYREYCRLFAVVFQDFSMFAFPLGENIAADGQPEAKRVTEALRKVGLGERLAELKDGLETYVGSEFRQEGVSFSGGEQQKMAIARAIYRDAPFVIMDEPTAALDPLAECEVYAGFDQMVGRKTAIYISHRLASCRFCEDILVFDQGSVVQRGNHEQLKDEDGIYRELWNAQAQYYAQE